MARKPNATKALAKSVKLPAKKATPAASAAPAELPIEPVQSKPVPATETVSVAKTAQEAPAKRLEAAKVSVVPKKPATKRPAAKALREKAARGKAQHGLQGYDDFASLGKDNIDACVKSGTVVAKGMEEVSKELIGFARSCLDANVKATQALMTVHSLKEVMDLQADFTRKSIDSWMAESAKLGDLSVKLANEAIEPIQGRVTETVEKVIKSAA